MATLKSEVELNKQNIKIGDVLYYTDNSNRNKYIVIGIEEDKSGFYCLNDEMEEEFYLFSELHFGWEISEKSKQYNKDIYRTVYV